MKPPKRLSIQDYEKVKTDDFITGIIEEIRYDQEHTFKGFKGKPDMKVPGVQFRFKLEGYEFVHTSRWMKFTYGEKSNLYLKYLLPLVEGAKPDMDFDLDQLKGLKVKTLWAEKDDFQYLDKIRPVGKKVSPLNVVSPTETAEVHEVEEDEEVPF